MTGSGIRIIKPLVAMLMTAWMRVRLLRHCAFVESIGLHTALTYFGLADEIAFRRCVCLPLRSNP